MEPAILSLVLNSDAQNATADCDYGSCECYGKQCDCDGTPDERQ